MGCILVQSPTAFPGALSGAHRTQADDLWPLTSALYTMHPLFALRRPFHLYFLGCGVLIDLQSHFTFLTVHNRSWDCYTWFQRGILESCVVVFCSRLTNKQDWVHELHVKAMQRNSLVTSLSLRSSNMILDIKSGGDHGFSALCLFMEIFRDWSLWNLRIKSQCNSGTTI